VISDELCHNPLKHGDQTHATHCCMLVLQKSCSNGGEPIRRRARSSQRCVNQFEGAVVVRQPKGRIRQVDFRGAVSVHLACLCGVCGGGGLCSARNRPFVHAFKGLLFSVDAVNACVQPCCVSVLPDLTSKILEQQRLCFTLRSFSLSPTGRAKAPSKPGFQVRCLQACWFLLGGSLYAFCRHRYSPENPSQSKMKTNRGDHFKAVGGRSDAEKNMVN
jgi:hypothetical protein